MTVEEAIGVSEFDVFWLLGNPTLYLAVMIINVLAGIAIILWRPIRHGEPIRFEPSTLFVLGFTLLLIIGSGAGVLLVYDGWNDLKVALHNSYYTLARFRYVLKLGAVFLFFAGFYAWFGRLSGRSYPEWAGRLHFWTSFIGVSLTLLPMYYLRLAGMPRRYVDYPQSLENWNMATACGAYLAWASTLFFVAMLVYVLITRRKAAAEP